MTEQVGSVQQASRALADGFSSLASLLETVDGGLAECASILSVCETALVGVSRGAALTPEILQKLAVSARAAQLLIDKLRTTVNENQRGIAKAMESIPLDPRSMPK